MKMRPSPPCSLFITALALLFFSSTVAQPVEVFLNQGQIHVKPVLIEQKRILIDHDWQSSISFWDIDRSMLLKRITMRNQFQAGTLAAQQPVKVSATGNFFVTETADSTFIYDVSNQTLVHRLQYEPGQAGIRNILAFVDQDRILMRSRDEQIEFTSTATWKPADLPKLHFPAGPPAVVTGDHLVMLRDGEPWEIRDFQIREEKLDSSAVNFPRKKFSGWPTLLPAGKDRLIILWQGGKTTEMILYDLARQEVVINHSIPLQTSYHRTDRDFNWIVLYTQPYGAEAVNMVLVDMRSGATATLTLSHELKRGLKDASIDDILMREGMLIVNCHEEKTIRGIQFISRKEWAAPGEVNLNWVHTAAGKVLYRTAEDRENEQYRIFDPADGTTAFKKTGKVTFLPLHSLSHSGKIQVIEKKAVNQYVLGSFRDDFSFEPVKWMGTTSIPLTGFVTGKFGDNYFIRLARPSIVVDDNTEFLDFGIPFSSGMNAAEPFVRHELSTGENEPVKMVPNAATFADPAQFFVFKSDGNFGLEQIDSIHLMARDSKEPMARVRGDAIMDLFNYHAGSLGMATGIQVSTDRKTVAFLINSYLFVLRLAHDSIAEVRKTDLQRITGKYLMNVRLSLSTDDQYIFLQAGTGQEQDVWKISVANLEPDKWFHHPAPIMLTRHSYPFLLTNDMGHTDLWNMDKKSRVKSFPWKKPDWMMNNVSAMFNDAGDAFLIHEASGTLAVYRTATGKMVNEWRAVGQIRVVAFRGTAIFGIGPSGVPFRLDIQSGEKSSFTSTLPVNQTVESDFIHAGDSLLLTSGTGSVFFWNLNTQKLFRRLFLIDSLHFLTMDDSLHYTTGKESTGSVLLRNGTSVSSVDQYDLILNRPSLFSSGSSEYAVIRKRLLEKAYQKRLRIHGVVSRTTRSDLNAHVLNRADLSSFPTERVVPLKLSFTASNTRLSSVNILVNNVPLSGKNGWTSRTGDTTVNVTLASGYNLVEIYGVDTDGMHSNHIPMHFIHTPDPTPASRTWFVGIGVNQFSDTRKNLNWSVKDIRDLAHMMKQRSSGLLVIDTLFDQQVTVGKVLALKKKLMQSGVNDKVVVAYSGHGLLNGNMDYFLSTHNVDFNRPEINGMPYATFESLVDGIPARKRLMLIDACHSGEIDPESIPIMNQVQQRIAPTAKAVSITVDGNRTIGIKPSFELMKELFTDVGKQTGATVISAAAGTQFANEYGGLRNGVFTWSILDAMKTLQHLTINDLKRIVTWKVPELTAGEQQPTFRNETLGIDWEIW